MHHLHVNQAGSRQEKRKLHNKQKKMRKHSVQDFLRKNKSEIKARTGKYAPLECELHASTNRRKVPTKLLCAPAQQHFYL